MNGLTGKLSYYYTMIWACFDKIAQVFPCKKYPTQSKVQYVNQFAVYNLYFICVLTLGLLFLHQAISGGALWCSKAISTFNTLSLMKF